jgi:hypothetical protein
MEDFFAPESGQGIPNLPPDQAGLLGGGEAPNLGGLPQEAGLGPEEAAGPLPAPSPESTLGGLTGGQQEAPPELGDITLSELLSLGMNSFLEQLLLQPPEMGGPANAEGTTPQAQGPSPQEGLQGTTGG